MSRLRSLSPKPADSISNAHFTPKYIAALFLMLLNASAACLLVFIAPKKLVANPFVDKDAPVLTSLWRPLYIFTMLGSWVLGVKFASLVGDRQFHAMDVHATAAGVRNSETYSNEHAALATASMLGVFAAFAAIPPLTWRVSKSVADRYLQARSDSDLIARVPLIPPDRIEVTPLTLT